MKLILKSLVVVGLLATGMFANDPGALTKPSAKVQAMIDKFNLKVVDFNYVKARLGKGTRNTAKIVLVDARPAKKYMGGTIPSSINIPDTDYANYVGQLKDTPKNKEIVVYCGGWKCGKSPKVANMLKKDGFTNVKLYQAGEPEWKKLNYREVGLPVIKAVQAKNSGVIIDARPFAKYLQETIPGAIAIPDTQVEELKGRFPVNHSEKIITFCGGFKCAKSHIIAKKLISMGYSDVNVYAAGMPAWKKAGLATTKSASKAKPAAAKEEAKFTKNGAKLSIDEGGVDGEWFYALYKDGKLPEYIQIVDIRDAVEYKEGHLKGAINVPAEKATAKEIVAKLPKGKTIIFHCSAGGRSVEAWQKVQAGGFDVSEILYFDANIDCKGTECKVEVNEPIG